MNFLIAPDSFKDCLSSSYVAMYISEGIKENSKDANVKCVPMSYGGEGFVQAMLLGAGGRSVEVFV